MASILNRLAGRTTPRDAPSVPQEPPLAGGRPDRLHDTWVDGVRLDEVLADTGQADDRALLTLLSLVDVPVAVCDAAGRVALASRGFQDLVGREPRGQRLERLVSLQTRDPNGQTTAWPLDAVLRGRAAEDQLIELWIGPGETRPLRVHARPLFHADQRVRGAVVVLDDRPQRDALAARVRELEGRLRLAQALERIGRSVAETAHGINNLLMTLTGFAELALAAVEPQHPVRDYLMTIKRGGDRLAGLARQLTVHGQGGVAAPRGADLRDAVLATEDALRHGLDGDLDLTVDLPQEMPPVRMEPRELQALLHLVLDHARTLSPGRGLALETQQVRLDEEEAAELHLSPGPWARLGVGPQPVSGSWGVRRREVLDSEGLATRVRAAGGGVVIETGSGRGPWLQVYLPLAGVPERTPSTVVPLNHAEWQGEATILLVEDEAAVRHLVGDILQLKGYTVLEASNGAEALQRVDGYTGRLDVLLTDVVMPLMGGRELSRRLRGRFPDLRVVFMSGHGFDAIPELAVLDEHEEFLAKPFTMRTLLELLQQRAPNPRELALPAP